MSALEPLLFKFVILFVIWLFGLIVVNDEGSLNVVTFLLIGYALHIIWYIGSLICQL